MICACICPSLCINPRVPNTRATTRAHTRHRAINSKAVTAERPLARPGCLLPLLYMKYGNHSHVL